MADVKPPVVGRFAPSPTGALHTGSLATAVGSYLMAKQAGGNWLLRLDDLDTRRQIPGMADNIKRTLESLSLIWDGEISRQSGHQDEYRHYFAVLEQTGALYPCFCSRREIALSASAPHLGDDCTVYPGTCRNGAGSAAENAPIRSWRVRAPEHHICFDDVRKGRICQHLPEVSGDFVIKRGDGGFAYQLAVVVDDHVTGVNQVVRGEDLLSSTPRQIYLQKLLGFSTPEYCHLPLVTGPDGSKLSKRDNLVSFQPEDMDGSEPPLLYSILRFLGLNPPAELASYSCSEQLRWGIRNFNADHFPSRSAPLETQGLRGSST